MREKTNDIIFSIIDLFPLLVRLQLLKEIYFGKSAAITR